MVAMRVLIVIGALSALLGMSVRADTVQVREATIRERPSFLGRVVGNAAYGDVLATAEIQGPWIQVARAGRTLGWVHASALTRRTVQLRSGDEDVDPTVSSDELALAGKGFSAEIEARYRARHGDAGFKQLDRMEQLAVAPRERAAFLKQGGLTPQERSRR
jgi:hypothetical protein